MALRYELGPTLRMQYGSLLPRKSRAASWEAEFNLTRSRPAMVPFKNCLHKPSQGLGLKAYSYGHGVCPAGLQGHVAKACFQQVDRGTD